MPVTIIRENPGRKHRLYPMNMTKEDLESGNWLHHPEIVKNNLREMLKKEHPTWIAKTFRLDPGLAGMSYKGAPMLPTTDEMTLIVVEVPESEDESLFASGGFISGFDVRGDAGGQVE